LLPLLVLLLLAHYPFKFLKIGGWGSLGGPRRRTVVVVRLLELWRRHDTDARLVFLPTPESARDLDGKLCLHDNRLGVAFFLELFLTISIRMNFPPFIDEWSQGGRGLHTPLL
jgi:hypothetical protein